MSGHGIVHIELAEPDTAAAARFYEEVFGWKTDAPPGIGDYILYQPDSGPGGGFTGIDNQMYKPGDVVVYIETDDIDATLKQIEAHGGRTLVPKSEIPGQGWFAMFSDPGGVRVALYTGMNQQS